MPNPNPAGSAPPSPAAIMEMMGAFRQTQALAAALDLDIFTRIGEGATTAAGLAVATRTAPRGMEILCDYLVVTGLLTKDGQRYGLAPEAAMFLDRRSPASLAETMNWWKLVYERAAGQDLADVVRTGGFEQPIAEPKVWVTFARSMAPMMAMPAQYMAEHVAEPALQGITAPKVLDIAGGHGLYGIAVARRHPQAHIVIVDAKPVLEVAKENADAAGVGARYHTLAGSALPKTEGEVDFGSGFDLALLTGFLHHFSMDTNVALLKKVKAAMMPGGKVVVFDFVPNEDRVSPPMPAAFSLTMLAMTAEGRAYTESEYHKMFQAAGLAGFERLDFPGLPATAMWGRAGK